MKKLLSILVAAGVLSAANAMAKDVNLVDMAQQAQDKIDATTKKMEDAKNVSSAKTDYKSQIEAKVQAKKDAAAKKQADNKAAVEAKKAERQKAIDDTKNSLKNLKNSFTAE